MQLGTMPLAQGHHFKIIHECNSEQCPSHNAPRHNATMNNACYPRHWAPLGLLLGGGVVGAGGLFVGFGVVGAGGQIE